MGLTSLGNTRFPSAIVGLCKYSSHHLTSMKYKPRAMGVTSLGSKLWSSPLHLRAMGLTSMGLGFLAHLSGQWALLHLSRLKGMVLISPARAPGFKPHLS